MFTPQLDFNYPPMGFPHMQQIGFPPQMGQMSYPSPQMGLVPQFPMYYGGMSVMSQPVFPFQMPMQFMPFRMPPLDGPTCLNGRWREEEHDIFIKGLKKYGRKWKKISLMVKTRTPVQIRTHAQKYFQSLKRSAALFGGQPIGGMESDMSLKSEEGETDEDAVSSVDGSGEILKRRRVGSAAERVPSMEEDHCSDATSCDEAEPAPASDSPVAKRADELSSLDSSDPNADNRTDPNQEATTPP